MEATRSHVRHCLLYEYHLGHTAARNIRSVEGEDAISDATVRRWFSRLREGIFFREDVPRSGRSTKIDEERLLYLIARDPRLTLRCLESEIGSNYVKIVEHLHKLGKYWKLGVWVPHELTATQLDPRVSICMNLLSLRRTYHWLNQLVTGDEKWVLYTNHTRKRQWLGSQELAKPTPKQNLNQMKVMLCVWWDAQGVLYWQLLPHNYTINTTIYCHQLDNIQSKIGEKRSGLLKIYFLHDNARPHIARTVSQKLVDFGWELLPHPSYSPDLAPRDFHL